MKDHHVPQEHLSAFARRLAEEERSAGTVEKYLRDAGAFLEWLAGAPVSREAVTGWKAHLVRSGYRPATINSMLAALNTFLRFIGLEDCRVRALRVPRRLFQSEERELSRQEYQRLLDTARTLGRDRLALVMETICAAGIRVSEVRYITVEAARSGQADIALKGKVRTILLPGKLCRKLLKYARQQKTASGEIFLTKSGKPLSRRQIWAEMKRLCLRAGVAPTKVFPHNLRHLFARTFYQATRDVAKLADVLGHSSIETTRIYLISTGAQHRRDLDRLRLVC